MLQVNKTASKRGGVQGSSVPQELQYKLQLPEIMQQQQTKINQMKKQHEIRFSSNKRQPLQVSNQSASLT